MTPRQQTRVLAGLFLSLLVLHARADRVVMRNGRSMDGLIRSESHERIVLDLGVGTMTVARDQVARLERSTPEQAEAIRQGWAEQYFLHEKYVPADAAELARQFRELVDRRAVATRARTDASAARQELVRLEREASLLRDELARASSDLQGVSPQQDVARYNAAVGAINSVRARQIVNAEAQGKARSAIDQANSTILDYADRVVAFDQSFRTRQASVSDPGTVAFMKRLETRLVSISQDVETVAVPVQAVAGNTVVLVRINGRISGNFIVDTGASMMTVTERFLGRLGKDIPVVRTIQVSLADGSTRMANVVMLQAVRVGDAELGNVEAAVLPSASGEQTDGLLGMTFLGQFHVQLDSINRQLTLRRLKP